ncbi:MAG TPA: Ig-like domain-containing protein, partial [Anaerolineae bacterium]|nr:Ig-like domain-containing protein [Anaerolineae bacterium]
MMKKLGLYGLALVLTVGMWWGMTEAGEMEGEIWLGGNTPPVANDDPDYTTPVNVNLISSPNSVLDNDTDAEGDGLTAVLVQTVSTGTLALQGDGTFIYLPPTDFAGVVTFTYRADDNISLSNVAVATITVNNP